MENRWVDADAAEFIARYQGKWGKDLALRTYLAVLIGSQDSLVLHGGGNASVKTSTSNILAEKLSTLYVKASGYNMAEIGPEGYIGLDLEYLKKLRALSELSDEEMAKEFRTHVCVAHSATPSIETLVHAFIPKKFIDHTHADAVLALTNQTNGEHLVREALGKDVLILHYVKPGFKLAQAAAAAFETFPKSKAMILMHHGLVTWGETARESYNTTIDLITQAERYLEAHTRPRQMAVSATPLEVARQRYIVTAPIIRGLLAKPSENPDWPLTRCILQPLITAEILELLDSPTGKDLALTSPLTADHLIRTKAFPLWIDSPAYEDPAKLRRQFADAIKEYSATYDEYIGRHRTRMPEGIAQLDSLPRIVLLPGLGAVCSAKDAVAATIVHDIAAHTLAVKRRIASMHGTYCSVAEEDLFDMEYRTLQQAKLRESVHLPLARETALITGAAGAIGSGIAQELLDQGCHVAITDLPGKNFDTLLNELKQQFGSRVMGAHLDVTDPHSVAKGFQEVILAWGGVDIVVINQGVALVAELIELDFKQFQKLERINTEGTLHILAEAGKHFKAQSTGGDIVLVSTKNVFSPGAKFGAYSATKAAAHQLARIASLEYAPMGVRVNMVAPDAVFSHGERRSGLWAEVGPDRARARGLDAAGLEEYYRNRNLLKTKVTAKHVARAVLFFVTHQTPTTGATIPVDGGLPDATPR